VLSSRYWFRISRIGRRKPESTSRIIRVRGTWQYRGRRWAGTSWLVLFINSLWCKMLHDACPQCWIKRFNVCLYPQSSKYVDIWYLDHP